jgi:hypothetical protein
VECWIFLATTTNTKQTRHQGIAATAGMQAMADQENDMWNAPQIAQFEN